MPNMAPARTRRKTKADSLFSSLSTYSLCELCFKRNIPRLPARKKLAGGNGGGPTRCQLCRGLMTDLDLMVSKIIDASKEFQFQTFLIGAVLPTQIFEREDAMRARFKIRGMESVKGQLTRELGLRFSRLTGKRVDYMRPDLTASIVVDKDNLVTVGIRTRPVLFFGKYTKKKRGYDQKCQRCEGCEGKGCNRCGNSGLDSLDGTVEGVITRGLLARTGGMSPRYSWIGSEDRESLVLGDGRPFYARIYNPMKRKFTKMIRICSDGICAKLYPIAEGKEPTEIQQRFIVKTRIDIKSERPIGSLDLKRLEALAGKEITLEIKGKKMATKKIYQVKANRAMGAGEFDFSLRIVADGGLAIKQFVGGEQFSSTSISQILGSNCQCSSFDILAVTFLSDKANQTFA